MNPANIVLTVALLSALGVTPALAECQIADAKLEEAILQKPELRGPAHRQSVRDLRSLRHAAFTLCPMGVMPIASASWPISANSLQAPRWAAWATTTRMRPRSRWPPASRRFS